MMHHPYLLANCTLQVVGRLACQFDPEARPSFATIISELRPAVTKEVEASNKPTTFMDTLSRFTSSWGGIMSRAIYGLPGKADLALLERGQKDRAQGGEKKEAAKAAAKQEQVVQG